MNECYIRCNGGNFSLDSDFQAGVTRVRLISAQQVLFQILKLPQRKKKKGKMEKNSCVEKSLTYQHFGDQHMR